MVTPAGSDGTHQQGVSGRLPPPPPQQQQQQGKRKPPAPPAVQAKPGNPYVIPLEVVRAAEEGRLTKRPHLDDNQPPRKLAAVPVPSKQPASSTQQQQELAPSKQAGAAAGTSISVGEGSSGGGKVSRKSGLPEEVRQRLLAAAPLVEGVDGDQWVGARHALTSSRISCEVYNHWGRADPDVELPQHRWVVGCGLLV
jgi:hypothetical protein